MEVLPAALQPLAAYRQFIVYKVVPRTDGFGKTDKLPIDHRTSRVMVRGLDWQNDPDCWTDADSAIQIAARLGPDHGIGFLFTADDPFVFIDIDGCYEPSTGWSEIANTLVSRLAGAAVEVSNSGVGLHIIGRYTSIPPHGCKDAALGLELYHERRFAALTGLNAVGDANTDLTAVLPQLVNDYFSGSQSSANAPYRPELWTTEPLPEYTGLVDDDELIRKARSVQNANHIFGHGASFEALWTADTETLSRAYPDNYGDRPYDPSSADAALAAHLAFWTGCDCERINRLMWQSALTRDKWHPENHHTYLSRTIINAVSRCTSVYSSTKEAPPPATDPPTLRPVESAPAPDPTDNELLVEIQFAEGFQYLSAHQQVDHFAGCVYVQKAHKVFTPSGDLLKPDQFKATYGGHVFALDASNDKTTRNAWEAFVESQVVRYPIAKDEAFRPELKPGALVEEEGRILVNTYVPPKIDRYPGNIDRFLDHLTKVLPDERDQLILLSFMAACVQFKGVKFQWCPLIQGMEGNGKTLFSRCVAYALGWQYTHLPLANEISEKFNEWLFRKLFIGVEDIYVPEHKKEVIEILKPMVTNDRYAKRAMQQSQVMGDNRANFILNSNHKNAIRKTRNDRRFAVFFSAQQELADLTRDGMTGDYFPDLYDWLKGVSAYKSQPSGYAQVAYFLETYPIPDEFNPSTDCQRAPDTSTTEQVIRQGLGSVEQEILEAIDEGRRGFAGGWVSSMALDKLLEERRLARVIPQNQRRDIMRSLGYDYHPALSDGRVNNAIALDGGKPRLYIQDGHPDREIDSPSMVAQIYQQTQLDGGQTLARSVFGKA